MKYPKSYIEEIRNRLKVSIYFYVVGVEDPVVVETFLERLR